MFSKILIANRGEIAARVIRTCRKMGIATAAVYSSPDAGSLSVEMADDAVSLGGVVASDTYLNIEKIIAAAKETGADAIHPGYGFLSENSQFAEACASADIVFIGPSPAAIGAMGDKLTAKALAAEAGVNTIPGGDSALLNANDAVLSARQVGYPVMLKAAAGGGGKGMRVVRDPDELEQSFESAAREALAAFGDGRIFVEKFIDDPRHIEIQILADSYGQIVHLGERECSIQRRHQKVIEEAPSPLLDQDTRRNMGEQAVALAKAVGYTSAGTVEFVADQGRNFYFLEMNTRLQVEHPVTEMVTGLDLVEWMIRIAAGERLALSQDDIVSKGWAVEARVYAEDPSRGFLPSTGRIVRYLEPNPGPSGIRIDSGVREGETIGIHYDPMIAKVIAHGADRTEATRNLSAALDRYVVRGLNHNIGFLSAVLNHPRYADGRLSTSLIEDEWPAGFEPTDEPEYAALSPNSHGLDDLTTAAAIAHSRQLGSTEMAGSETIWAVILNGAPADAQIIVVRPVVDGIEARAIGSEAWARITSDWRAGGDLMEAQIDGESAAFTVERVGLSVRIRRGGRQAEFLLAPGHVAEIVRQMPTRIAADTGNIVTAPMPGLLVALLVETGQQVKAGEPIAVIEAMKMENILKATRDGTVAKVHVAAGDSLAVEQTVLEFD
jgi:propionyl-CoA carboxylase alpha chain